MQDGFYHRYLLPRYGHRLSATRTALPCTCYPPNANKPRFNRMVKPALSTIQNRHPLPNQMRSPFGHLHFEHRIVHDRFQVGQDIHLSTRVNAS
jgi:hypothetical protein